MSDKIENRIVKELKNELNERMDECKDRVDVIKTLMKLYCSMYATVPKEGRDMLNEIEDDMKTKMVNYSLEKGYIPN